MSEYYDANHRSTSTLRQQEWEPARRQHYPPPQDVNQYASKALPLTPAVLPPRPPSSSSSIYDSDNAPSRQSTPQQRLTIRTAQQDRTSINFAGAVDEAAFAMVQPPPLNTNLSHSYEQPHVVSPQPLYSRFRLISMWDQGDAVVSPMDTPGTANWQDYVVSPVSQSSDKGAVSEPDRASCSADSWADQTEQRYSSSWKQSENQVAHDAYARVAPLKSLYTQTRKTTLRYSDPGSPLSSGLDTRGFGEPGPDVGRSRCFEAALDHQKAATHVHTQSMYSSDWRDHPQNKLVSIGDSQVSFAVPKIDTFSSSRPGVSRRPAPAPLKLSERSIQNDYVKTPFPPRANPDSSENSVVENGNCNLEQQHRASGLISFSKSLRPSSSHKNEKSPSGFPESLSQLENQARASPLPKVKNILSKAKQGLWIGSEGAKKEKRREDLKRQIRLGSAE
ncbi:hypothetical protein F5Y19DRAFT_369671 [Xylariaceae sp. FL1651]|nr:hypothetical protein F5Y19DRAFT_369671 [Xylariaceae sp. FL1651]